MSIRERVNVIELSAIRQLLEKFIANKIKLLEEYKLKDTNNTGAVSMNDWVAVTSQVLDLKLPWRSLRSKLVKINPEGLIIYESVFEGIYISRIQTSVIRKNSNFEKI